MKECPDYSGLWSLVGLVVGVVISVATVLAFLAPVWNKRKGRCPLCVGYFTDDSGELCEKHRKGGT